MKVLIDLDGTVVDLVGYALRLGLLDHYPCRWAFHPHCSTLTESQVFETPYLFRDAPPIDGAIAGVQALMTDHDVHFVSTPWHTSHASAMHKYEWVEEHFGDGRLLTLTHRKADIVGDVLIDDKPGLAGPWRHIVYAQPWNDGSFVWGQELPS